MAYCIVLYPILSYDIILHSLILYYDIQILRLLYTYTYIYIYYSISFYIMSYHTALLQSFFTIVLLKGMHSVWVYCRSIELLYNPTEACLYHWSSMQPDTIVVMCNMQFVDEAGSIAVRVYVCICNGTRTQQHDKNRYNAWTQTLVILFWCVLLLIFKAVMLVIAIQLHVQLLIFLARAPRWNSPGLTNFVPKVCLASGRVSSCLVEPCSKPWFIKRYRGCMFMGF